MEETKPKHKPSPGIAEALHPEIGNGSALETDRHAFVLRSPDPSNQLAEYLSLSDEDIVEIAKEELIEKVESQPVLSEEEISPNTPVSNPEHNVSQDPHQPEPGIHYQPEEAVLPTKSTKKKKGGKQTKLPDPTETNPEENEPVEGKPQKAGKLLRKAAKSIKKQEVQQKTSNEEKIARPGLNLSPFTSWLKNLTGSDYVHPYEDDFAFEQAAGAGKEGISETFADLLAAQGYKDQAREMYIKLMEKYPEKSGFFAAKLEALQ